MSNWKYWYQSFLDEQNKKIAEAFKKGLEGDLTPITTESKPNLNTWQNIKIASISADKNFNLDLSENGLNFNNDILNAAYTKSFKNISNFSIYSPQLINKIFYFYLSDPKLSFKTIIEYCQDIPLAWFSTCPNCDAENEDDWIRCKICGKTFEESLDG